MTTDIAQVDVLPDVATGELLPVTVPNIVRVLKVARDYKRRVDEVVRAATAAAVHFSEHEGTKTLHSDGGTVKLTGGPTVEYDVDDLREALEAAGCPQHRIDATIVPTVTYKVNRTELRKLAGANQDYKAAIELAERLVEKRYQAAVE